MWYRKFILAVIDLVIMESNCFKFPPQYSKVLRSLQGSAGATIKTKILYGELQADLLAIETYEKHLECHSRLLHIMADDLKCPRATSDLKSYLGIMEYSFNLTRDEKFVRSLFESNCTYLSDRSAKVCLLISSRGTFYVRYAEFSKIIYDCQSEHLEQGGDLSQLLSERSDTSI